MEPEKVDGGQTKDSHPKGDNARRQIVVETDGNNIFLVKAEVGGKIELVAILNLLATHFSQQK